MALPSDSNRIISEYKNHENDTGSRSADASSPKGLTVNRTS